MTTGSDIAVRDRLPVPPENRRPSKINDQYRDSCHGGSESRTGPDVVPYGEPEDVEDGGGGKQSPAMFLGDIPKRVEAFSHAGTCVHA